MNPSPSLPRYAPILTRCARRDRQRLLAGLALGLCVISAAFRGGVLDSARYAGAARAIFTLASDALPPDFTRWRNWVRPLLDTLAMGVAGTALGVLAALPLGALAAGNLAPSWIREPVKFALNLLRSIPGLVWGILFVAAVGFGPLPGILALACHSTGMLGKFFAELIEHANPTPGTALRGQGVSTAGVLRFAILPQVAPRILDVSLYRFEHNLRSATTLGMVGAGGLGLEIVTAFHLFEYREAMALLTVVLGLVTLVNLVGSRLRAWLLGTDQT